MRAPSYIADFDSATAMVRANARFLEGKGFPATGQPRLLKAPATMANLLPRWMRERIYVLASGSEGIKPSRIRSVDADRVARWVVGNYPRRTYPAAFVGSGSGAVTHLATAMRGPWLPQTFMVPVSQPDVAPDDPWLGLAKSIETGRKLLEANPDLKLHLMHDPNQDRLTLERLQYFRVKWRRLPAAYRRFLVESLPEGATLFVVECNRTWPTTRIDDRFTFQFGAVGGATPHEFHHGSDEIADYLDRYGLEIDRWNPPPPDGESPEAEWGFEESLRDDLLELADERGWHVQRIGFDDPEQPSPLVAELYRWWYQQRGIQSSRLVVSSFVLMEPLWTMRTGSIPFWMTFNKEPSAAALERYLDEYGPFDEIHLMLFAHGAESAGLPPMERWTQLLDRARRHGAFAGVDPTEHPFDLPVYARYDTALKRIPARYPLPPPLTVEQLEKFLSEQGDDFPVAWSDGSARAVSQR